MDARTIPWRKRSPGVASNSSARRSVSAASRPVKWSSSATSAARARVASGPSTAAASASARAPGGSRSRRRAVARPTDSDPIPTSPRGSDWPSSPASLALARSAFTRKGTPPDSLARVSRKSSAASGKPSSWASRAIPSALSGASRSTCADGTESRRSARSAFGPVSPVVREQTITTGRSSRRCARYSRNSSDGRSTHCRSSTAISATRRSASRLTRRHMPLSVASVDGPWPFPLPFPFPRPFPSMLAEVSSGAAAPAAARSSARSTGSSGLSRGSSSWRATANAKPTSSSPPRARSVAASSSSAIWPSSARRRDFPMPEAPSKRSRLPWIDAPSRAFATSSNSGCRSMRYAGSGTEAGIGRVRAMHACCNPPGERAQISLTEHAEVQANCVRHNFRRVPNCYSSGLKTRPVGTLGKK